MYIQFRITGVFWTVDEVQKPSQNPLESTCIYNVLKNPEACAINSDMRKSIEQSLKYQNNMAI
jgi:hypothetical protein